MAQSAIRTSALDELQLSLGEGPSLDAFAMRETILEPDLEHARPARRLIFTATALELGTRGVFAFKQAQVIFGKSLARGSQTGG